MTKRSQQDKSTRKYLSGHAEAEAQLVTYLTGVASQHGHGLVIPCYGEGEGVARALRTIPSGPRGPVLTIVIVNACSESPPWVHEANAKSLERIRLDYNEPECLSPGVFLHAHPAGSLLVIDRATRAFLPPRQGVGLARKIGADLILALIAQGQIDSPWIHCSDADVAFPADYFEQIEGESAETPAARIYRFRHVGDADPRTNEAALQYEISLRYYVLGLRFANSAYAFHSIGSTLALHATAYTRVRGFPRRRAAEDFYLLNKIAKVGAVENLEGAPLELSSRPSSRVPFGTGASVIRLLEAPTPALEMYDPAVFHHLRAWQRALEQAGRHCTQQPDLRSLIREQAHRDTRVQAERLMETLESLGALEAAEAALAASPRAASKRLHDGFDGFRTLKLVHALRDEGLPDLPMREALARSPFISLTGLGPSPSTSRLADRVEALDSASCGTLREATFGA